MPLIECTHRLFAIFEIVDPETKETRDAGFPVLAWAWNEAAELATPMILNGGRLTAVSTITPSYRVEFEPPSPPEPKPAITRPGTRPPKHPGRDPR